MYPGVHAATDPDKPAQIMAGTGEVMTFRELDEMANRARQLFADLGLEPGDHVALCMENHPLMLAVVWGAHYAGPLLHRHRAPDSRPAELDVHRRRLRGQGRSSPPRTTDAARRQSCVAPNVGLELMLDGTADGYESLRGA